MRLMEQHRASLTRAFMTKCVRTIVPPPPAKPTEVVVIPGVTGVPGAVGGILPEWVHSDRVVLRRAGGKFGATPGAPQVLVKWKGQDYGDATWEDEAEMDRWNGRAEEYAAAAAGGVKPGAEAEAAAGAQPPGA